MSETKIKIVQMISKGQDFNVYCTQVEKFNAFSKQANDIVGNIYYAVGKLDQNLAKENLKEFSTDIVNILAKELIAYHREFNKSICSEFEMLESQASDIPSEVKALFELNEYILWASKVLINELEEKIQRSICILSSLLQITSLTEEHIELNKRTINYLESIKPVFDRNNVSCEAMKSKLEDELQQRINVLNAKVEEIFPKLVILDDMDDVKGIREYLEDLKALVKTMDEIDEQVKQINMEEKLFKFPETSFLKVIEINEIISVFYSLIYLIYQWQRDNAVWLDGPFEYLDATVIQQKTVRYFEEFTQISRDYKLKIKTDIATNKPYRFSGIVDDPDPMQQPAPLKLCWQVLEEVNQFKQNMRLLICMCNPALMKRHWDEMSTISGFDLTPNAGTTLRKMIAFDLTNNIDKYEIISIGANMELTLRQRLSGMIEEWDSIIFTIVTDNKSNMLILTDFHEIQILLDEHLVRIQEMRGSYFVQSIESAIIEFFTSLTRIQNIIEQWTQLQKQWLYLFPVFSNVVTAIELHEEKILFLSIENTLRYASEEVLRDLTVQRIGHSAEFLEKLQKANNKMERVSEGVSNLLERKRYCFPRFFFLSDSEILQVLFEDTGPAKVQAHLKKCFVHLKRLEIDKNCNVCSIVGDYNEELPLQNVISTLGTSDCIENWLIQLEKEIVNTVRYNIYKGYCQFDETLLFEWISNSPGMIVACILQIYWTSAVHSCLLPQKILTLESYREQQSKLLIDAIDKLKNRLTRRTRMILMTSISIKAHQIEVTKSLIVRNVSQESDFDWSAQLRYYWQDEDVKVMIIGTTLNYAYEYSGNEPYLVRTPLTDRCYHTLMGARYYRLYGAIQGPSSTGKTETIKSLARAIAVQLLVFNCNDSLDCKSMVKLFKGLISCGAWICLDDFNRIKMEVLSVVAQQISCVSQAVSSNLRRFVFEGTELNVNPTAYICITMNSECPGRSDLPDNLKVLFRAMSMVLPDFAKVSEIELFAAGFSSAKTLAVKLVNVYKLCAEQMSSQSHYDFGARTIKAIVKMAICLKIRYPNENEEVLLLRALIDASVPKFLEHDILIFQGIVQDLFPDVTLPPPNYTAFLKAFEQVCKKKFIHAHEMFKLKTIQVFEMIHVRHAFMLIGEPFGGKTTILRTLADTLSLLHEQEISDIGLNVTLETINPKAFTSSQFFGHVDTKSTKWNDGIYSTIFRTFAKDDSPSRKWLVLDGPMDITWIENMNTVLDDNKTLFLASGERITMSNSMSLIFETMDLLRASPALVSRCGMIHVEPEATSWRPFVQSWTLTYNFHHSQDKLLHSLLDWSIEPCLQFIRKKCKLTIAAGELHLLVSTLNLLKIYLEDAFEENPEEKERKQYFAAWLQAALILSTIWGAAGTLDFDSQMAFDAFYVSLWNGTNEHFPLPKTVKQSDVFLPSEGPIRDNFYTFKGKGSWKHWGDVLKSEKIVETYSLRQMMVPTVDTVRYTNLFLRHVKHCKPFLLCGDTATGKTCCIQDLLTNGLSREKYLPNSFSFISNTTASTAQQLFLSKLKKLQKDHYGLPKEQLCVNFIDDINISVKEVHEEQSYLELIRQYFDHGYWYNLKELEKIFVRDVMFLSATTLRNDVYLSDRENIHPRFLRHFNVYSMHAPLKDNIYRIFSNFLLARFKRNSFNADIISSVNNIVNATIDVYMSIKETLLPVPAKFHYQFNIRDIFRVVHGCGLIHKESVETKITFLRLWVHEVLRVFNDRITDNEDKEWLFLKIKQSIKNHFKDSFEAAFDHLPKSRDNRLTKESFRYLIFGNFMDTNKSFENRRYEEVNTLEAFKNKALFYLEEYNNTRMLKMNIVLFHDALEHLARICRILTTAGGNILMVCIGGSGKRSLTRLAAHMERQSLFESAMGPFYDLNTWRKDLKVILKDSSGSGKDVALFFTDRQIKEAFLQDISSLLNSGEIPNLFTIDERQSIIETIRLSAQNGNRNMELSNQAVMDYFTNQCKEKLHFVICFNPTSRAFREHLRSHPSLTNHCTIDWFEPWSNDALEQVAMKYIKTINTTENIRVSSVTACKYFHNCAKDIGRKLSEGTRKRSYVTPSAFLHMIRLYTDHISAKQEEITMTRKRYLSGLEKLQLAADRVAQMKATLTTLRPQLELSAEQTASTMKEIKSENISVESATILVKRDEEIANKKAEIAGILKTECEADLAVAIPILEDAIAALNTLKPTDITLVKAMKNPPDTVKLVMAAVCVMLNVSPDRTIDSATGKRITDYWGPSKRILGDMNFLQNLKDYEKDNIPATLMQVIKKIYMTDKNFTPNIVAKASSAAEGLCKWVRAMVSYDEIVKVVAPKKEKLAVAQKECDEIKAFLNEKRKTLAVLNTKLAALNRNLQATLATKLELENEIAECTSKLIKAESLISSLGGEKTRWMQCVESLQRSYDNLAGDMLLSCATIAYLASYDMTRRSDNLKSWKLYVNNLKIPCSKDYSFSDVLGSEIKISSWYAHGLSRNRFYVDNAIIMDSTKLWSLFVDPQNQADAWIKEMEECNDLQVVNLSDPSYVTLIRHSIQCGKPVLLGNVKEKLDAVLDPILSRNIYKDGGTWYLNVDQEKITYHYNFRLYAVTKLHNPNYSPDTFNKITVIDFTLPGEAFRDRLLDIVVTKEKPELQEKYQDLFVQIAANKKVLIQEEDNILRTLSTSSIDILEDESAIRILDSSKSLCLDMTRRQETIGQIKSKIDTFRETYSQFTKYCAALHSTLMGLSNLNPMYHFSLTWFTQLYVMSIKTANMSVLPQKRLDYLKTTFTRNLYSSICSSLFERHKLLYSFILCITILSNANQITKEEIQFFMRMDIEEYPDTRLNPVSTWLPDKSWRKVCRASDTLPIFRELTSSLSSATLIWQEYYNLTNPQDYPLPQPWNDKLMPFQELVVIKILRPDKIIAKIIQFIESSMGKAFVASSWCNISRSYMESSCLTPLIFILPSDADPTTIILNCARKVGYSSKLLTISMGQGQEHAVKCLIEQARTNGWWIFLQNCHLVLSWLSQLEKIYENFNATNTSLEFRLWLSSYPTTEEFPISILQNSVKIACDAPVGLKQHLLRLYRSEPLENQEFFEGCPGKDKIFAKLLYGLCFFHAVIQERKCYGPQGWNVSYNFDESDYLISIQQLQTLINENDKVPFNALLYLIGECNYGGRVMEDMDRKCLKALLIDYCNEKVISDPNYAFAKGTAYSIPNRHEYHDYVRHIENIPMYTSPEVFGLDANASIVRDKEMIKEFSKSMSLIDNDFSIDDKELKEKLLQEMIKNIRDKLPETFKTDEIQSKYPFEYFKPTNTVLIQEAIRYNRLLTEMKVSLSRLESIYKGRAILTLASEKLSKQIFIGEIPTSWKIACAYPSDQNLSNFIDNLLKRLTFIRNWINDGLPSVIWLPGLSSCKAFLSAVRLTFARKNDVSIDKVTFEFQVMPINESPETIRASDNEVYIDGLSLSGARWDVRRMILTESLPNVLWNPMPIICFGPTKSEILMTNKYECPLYTTAARRSNCNSLKRSSNYILSVLLDTDISAGYWLKNGTALICQTE